MYKINTHNMNGVRNYVNNPDWRVVMANYVCMHGKCESNSKLPAVHNKKTFNNISIYWTLNLTKNKIKINTSRQLEFTVP